MAGTMLLNEYFESFVNIDVSMKSGLDGRNNQGMPRKGKDMIYTSQ